MSVWTELLVLQTMVGYCFVIANTCIGLSQIRDLNIMKGEIGIVKAHKLIGTIETLFFYVIMAQCLMMMAMMPMMAPQGIVDPFWYNVETTYGIHTMIGGISAFILFTFKAYIAFFKKDIIYKYGQFIGPIGFIGWSLAHWTSMVDFYLFVLPEHGGITQIVPTSFFWASFMPFPIGIAMFLGVMLTRSKDSSRNRFSTHQIAFILHGITFGYEKAAKELLGTPAMFKYVVPKTYEFLEKMMHMLGIDLQQLSQMNISDAMDEFMKKAANIRMAEKIKVKWENEKTFTVESINCSTARVRSSMSKEELTNAICPWAIMAASIVNKITGKNLEIDPSEFNEIGAKTTLRLKE